MRFLRPLLGIKRWNHQRNPGIHNRFIVNNLIQDIKLPISIELGRPHGKNGQKPLTQTSFPVSTPGLTGCWRAREELESTRTP
jgi:hypothetical protein